MQIRRAIFIGKLVGGINGMQVGESADSGAHEVPFVALLIRVSKRRWSAGGGITRGELHSGAFIH